MSDVEDVPETQLEIDMSDGAGLEEGDDDDMEQITAQKVRGTYRDSFETLKNNFHPIPQGSGDPGDGLDQ